MGSGHVDTSKQSGWSQAIGGSSQASSQGSSAYGASGGTSGGTSFGTSTGTQDVWGPQAQALQALYGAAGNLAGGQGAAANQSQKVAQQAQSAWLNQLTPGANPYFSNNVQAAIDQATQGFNQNVLPGLDARGVQVGQYGSPRDSLARGQAAGQFGQGLAQQVAGMYSNQYAADQARASQALGMSGTIQGMQTAPLTTAAGIIGGPTVLGQTQATSGSQQTANQWANNVANSYGQSVGQSFNNVNSRNVGNSFGTGGAFMSKE